MGQNAKSDGEKGQTIAIGELAKYNIDVCIPMSDNLPFDFIIIYEGKLLRAQVKSGGYSPKQSEGSIQINLRSNNWHKKTIKKYNSEEVDTIILCDYSTIYLLEKHEWENRNCFTIRYDEPKNGQRKCHFAKDYIISEERIKKIFTPL